MSKLKKGDKVIAQKEIRTCVGGKQLVRSGDVGEVVFSYPRCCTVVFPDRRGTKYDRVQIWFDDRDYPGYAGSPYPPLSTLKKVPSECSCQEGQSFTILKDNGDGTFLIRKEQ